MYNNFYKGYKSKRRHNFLSSKNLAKDREKGVAHLHIIRAVCVALAILLVLSLIVVAIVFFGSGSKLDNNSSNVDSISQEDREELLTVVNRHYPLEEDYVPELYEYKDYSVNVLAKDNLEKLISNAQYAGYEIKVNYAYVSYADQAQMFEAEYNRLLKNDNLSQVRAEAQAQSVVSKAGESEYQTGLLIKFDVTDASLKWLQRYCVDYGFVQRYTSDNKNSTGMNEDLYSFRYVGVDDAKMMRTLDMSLNEYASYIRIQQG